MKALGLVFNTRKILTGFILLVLGLSMMAYGVISYYEDTKRFNQSMSDEDIIIRAKELGMIELKTIIEENGEQKD